MLDSSGTVKPAAQKLRAEGRLLEVVPDHLNWPERAADQEAHDQHDRDDDQNARQPVGAAGRHVPLSETDRAIVPIARRACSLPSGAGTACASDEALGYVAHCTEATAASPAALSGQPLMTEDASREPSRPQ